MRLLLINPNTSQPVTDAVLAAASMAASPGTALHTVTGRTGPAVIGSRTEEAIAQREVLELAAEFGAQADAIVLGVSLDTALWPARELMGKPVIGMTEAGLLIGATVASRIGVLTYGRRMAPLYRELVDRHGLTSRLAGIEAVDVSPLDGLASPARAQEAVLAGVVRLVQRDGAEAVVLAGAAMAAMASTLQAHAEVPLLDGVACAVALAEARVRLALPAPRTGSLAPLQDRQSIGLAPALATQLLGARP